MANTPNPVPGGAGNPASATNSPAQNQPAAGTTAATSTAANTTTRRPRVGARTTPPARLAYTRHATAGDGDDRIVNPAWYRFLLIMLGIGGAATLFWILYGGVQWGKATASVSTGSSAPITVVAPTPAATPPVQPQVIQPMVVQPVVIPPVVIQPQVIQTPAATGVDSPPPLLPSPRQLTDAEQRNEALKERLRARYGIQ